MKKLIKTINENIEVYRDDKTGIAWVEDGTTGSFHSCHPNIDVTGSAAGMKKLGYWGKRDRVVKTNGFKYNVSKKCVNDDLDKIAEKYCQCECCR